MEDSVNPTIISMSGGPPVGADPAQPAHDATTLPHAYVPPLAVPFTQVKGVPCPMPVKELDKPWYNSKKCVMYVLTLISLSVMAALRAPASAMEHVAMAVAIGLPVLLGVQGWADRDAIQAVYKSVGADK